jgi:hypothetical protein
MYRRQRASKLKHWNGLKKMLIGMIKNRLNGAITIQAQ